MLVNPQGLICKDTGQDMSIPEVMTQFINAQEGPVAENGMSCVETGTALSALIARGYRGSRNGPWAESRGRPLPHLCGRDVVSRCGVVCAERVSPPTFERLKLGAAGVAGAFQHLEAEVGRSVLLEVFSPLRVRPESQHQRALMLGQALRDVRATADVRPLTVFSMA